MSHSFCLEFSGWLSWKFGRGIEVNKSYVISHTQLILCSEFQTERKTFQVNHDNLRIIYLMFQKGAGQLFSNSRNGQSKIDMRHEF